MAAPDASKIFWRPGTNGVPTNDTSPIGGAIDTGEVLTPGADGQIIAGGEADAQGGSSRVHYGVANISVEEGAGGSLTVGKLCLANGALLIPAQGQIVVIDSTGENEGLQLVVCGFVDEVQLIETIEITEGAAETDALFDADSHWWIQTLDGAAIAGANGTDDLVVKVGTEDVAMMRAPHVDLWPSGTQTVGTFYALAQATNVDAALSAANRLTPPTATGGVSSYASGVLLDDGTDARLPLGTIEDGEFKSVALRRTIPAGMRAPDGGMPHALWLTGMAVA